MITFADKRLPSYVKVSNIKHSILPSIQHKTATVLGRAGAYDFGVDLGMRRLSIDIQIIGATQSDIMNKATQLAEWLFYEDLQPLIIDDEADKLYMARITGETDLSEIYRVGEGTLEFICPNAYKESIDLKSVQIVPTDDSIMQVDNMGSAKVYPKITLNIKADTPALSLVSDEDFILLGGSEATKSVVDNNPLVLGDSFDTYTGWTTGLATDSGTTSGTYTSNGYSISVAGKDYGTGSLWHGASAIKSLPVALQDFEVQTAIGHSASSIKQVGRVEVYLLDVNNSIIGKMAMVDGTTTGDHARVEARAGSLQAGNYFVNSYGSKRGVWANSSPAIIRIGRKGNVWSFYVGKQASDGSHNTRLYKEWIDVKNTHKSKVAKIMIHIGSYGTHTPVNAMYFSDLKVWDRSVVVDTSTQVGMTFKKDSVVTIDCSKAVVLVDGEPAYHLLNPSSSFFPLEKGLNGLVLSPAVADVTIEYRERWL